MSYRYPLATSTWDEAEHEAMQAVIRSGMFTMGSKVAEFEQRFAEYIGSRYCVMVNSGSSANLLMIAALFYTKNPSLRLQRGDEVIVPAVSWSTTYYPLYQYGLKIKFVDVDLETLNLDLGQLKAAIGEKTRAILAVNLLGNPNDFTAIRRVIGDRNILLLEDNCESMGAEFAGRKAGTFGLMGSFSSFFSHHISTMEGGLVVTDDEELYHILLSLRAHGWTRNLPKVNRVCGVKSDDPFEESFRFVLPGYNVRPLELSGAIGIKQLEKLPSLVLARRRNAERFVSLMRQFPWLTSQHETGASSWFGFALVPRKESTVDRAELQTSLSRHGIETRPIVAGNFAKNEVVHWFNYEVHGTLSNAEYIDRAGLFIGNHHYDLAEEFDVLGRALAELGGN